MNSTMLPLETAPSFSIYNSADGIGDELKSPNANEESLITTVATGRSGDFSFGKKGMGLIEEGVEEENGLEIQNLKVEEGKEDNGDGDDEPVTTPMYLATGLGIDDGGFGAADLVQVKFEEGCGDGDAEEYYRRMVEEFPCHPLVLRNYAQILQSKGDLHGAEDYYYRATQADPDNGKISMQYAKLVWELYQDSKRALSYFSHAVEAAPHDSDVLAAYARFLWEIEDDEEEDEAQQDNSQVNIKKAQNGAADFSYSGDTEEYYRRMVDEHPDNPLLLRNYAQFLIQSKGDLQEAEQLYSCAVLADPNDGEIVSEYAKLIWELHHDLDKALCYFERAVEASPKDSHVRAAYASFLWEIEDDGDNEESSSTRQHLTLEKLQL